MTISAATLHETFDSGGTGPLVFTPRLALELVLLALLFASLVASAMALRFYNHAGFIGSLPVGSAERQRWMAVGVKYVRRAGVLYSWSLRHLVIVAPILASILVPRQRPVRGADRRRGAASLRPRRRAKDVSGPAGEIVPSKD